MSRKHVDLEPTSLIGAEMGRRPDEGREGSWRWSGKRGKVRGGLASLYLSKDPRTEARISKASHALGK